MGNGNVQGGRLNPALNLAMHTAADPAPVAQPAAQPQLQSQLAGAAHAASGGSGLSAASTAIAVTGTSASAPASSSPAAARADAVSPVPQIPRHRLGGPTTPHPELVRALAVSPFSMPPRAALQSTQRPEVQAESANGAAPFINDTALILTGDEACTFLSEPGNLNILRELRLLNCRDADLINIARVLSNPLQGAPSTAFALVLDKFDGAELSAAGFHALAGLRLAGITLNALPIPREIAEQLSMGVTSLTIKLPRRVDGQTDLDALSQIPTLASVDVGRHPLSSVSLGAFASHPSLTTLRFASLSGKVLCQLLENPKLRTLSTDIIVADESEAFAALADHQTLTALRIGHVSSPAHLSILSRNRSLVSLDLQLSPTARTGMRDLAAIPTLTTLALSISGDDLRLGLDDVRALCTKTYSELRFTMVEIEPAAQLHIAATQTKSLVLDYCFYITDQTISALLANSRIATLSAIGCVNESQAMALATMPSVAKLTVDFASDAAISAEARLMRIWLSAGKSLANLDLTALGDVVDEDEDIFL